MKGSEPRQHSIDIYPLDGEKILEVKPFETGPIVLWKFPPMFPADTVTVSMYSSVYMMFPRGEDTLYRI